MQNITVTLRGKKVIDIVKNVAKKGGCKAVETTATDYTGRNE